MLIIKVLFWISIFTIFWANIGYSLSLLIIDKIFKIDKIKKDYNYEPTVTIMIVAHNEEKVIRNKMINVLNIDYPNEKIEILVSSDNSTDKTNEIVRDVIDNNKDRNIKLYEVKERKGKTNAQNEAAKLVKSEILVMTDANAMLEKKSIRELVASFSDKGIVYVTGRLSYSNSEDNLTSKSESTYWDLDLKIRDIESRLQTITAGNGAIYACRTKEYICFNPINCHDSLMPLQYALDGKRAIANHDAIAYEKAGENVEDEFKRKVRMNRNILFAVLPDIKILNFFKYKWFTYFYLGHRTSRYLLWLMHIIALITSGTLMLTNYLYMVAFLGQIILCLLVLFKHIFKINNKILNFIYYYFITIIAQIIGIKNILTGNAKPFWEKAESTR